MSGSVHFRVEMSAMVFGQEFAKGDLIEVPAADAERYTGFWMQFGPSVVHVFAAVSDEELAALTAPAPVVPLPPPPTVDELLALRLEDLREQARAVQVQHVETLDQAQLIEAIMATRPVPETPEPVVPEIISPAVPAKPGRATMRSK